MYTYSHAVTIPIDREGQCAVYITLTDLGGNSPGHSPGEEDQRSSGKLVVQLCAEKTIALSQLHLIVANLARE